MFLERLYKEFANPVTNNSWLGPEPLAITTSNTNAKPEANIAQPKSTRKRKPSDDPKGTPKPKTGST
ncbi:MAG: hypothetical protein ACKEQK_00620, partial [Candidatus Hodgkinia cicadicola]